MQAELIPIVVDTGEGVDLTLKGVETTEEVHLTKEGVKTTEEMKLTSEGAEPIRPVKRTSRGLDTRELDLTLDDVESREKVDLT